MRNAIVTFVAVALTLILIQIAALTPVQWGSTIGFSVVVTFLQAALTSFVDAFINEFVR